MAKRIGIVGLGFIGAGLAREILACSDGTLELAFVHTRSGRIPDGILMSAHAAKLEDFASFSPDLIVEAAHPAISREYGTAFLECADYMPLSVTALADDDLRDTLVSAAAHHNRSIFIPSGALVGTEGLVASRAMWKEVTITFRKHPKNIDFSDTTIDPVRIATETTVYDGPVRGIASLYPRNVNTMVTCALATLGLDRTRGRLIADPSLDHAVAEVEAHGTDGSYLATQKRQPAIGVSGTEMFRSTLRSVRVASGVRNPIDFV